mmetsp:Transcript_23596/g.27320  ORF Transcript_23596/g.27320 Transcript_23596/m.27320 type:complete len:301 (+) Transcript_23596:58-960(+)
MLPFPRTVSRRLLHVATAAPAASSSFPSSTTQPVVRRHPTSRLFAVTPSPSVFRSCRVLLKDVKRSDYGESRRLSFDERAERRTPKSREQKQAREQLMLEAEQYVDSEFPDELERLFEKTKERCNMISLRILNIAKCIECLEVDAPGTSGPNAKKILLLQAAQVVKTKANELEVSPTITSMASAVLNRISRFDASLQVTREQNKIRVIIPPMTTARRDKAAADIRAAVTDLKHKSKVARQNATKVLQGLDIEEGLVRQHGETLDSKVHDFIEEKTMELEMMAEEVMNMGVDESDSTGTVV